MWDVSTSLVRAAHLCPLTTYREWPPNLSIPSLMIKVSSVNSPLQARTSKRKIVLRVILASRVLSQVKKNVLDFGLPGPNPVLLLKEGSYDPGEVFVKKELLKHMCVIQVHLLRLPTQRDTWRFSTTPELPTWEATWDKKILKEAPCF